MSDPHKRLHTLLTDRSIAGLGSRAEEELQYLLAGGAVDPSYEQAAAAMELSLHDHGGSLPEYIEAAVLVQAGRYHGFTDARPHELTVGRPTTDKPATEPSEELLLGVPESEEAPHEREWEESPSVDAALESGVLESSLTDGRIDHGGAAASQQAPIVTDLEPTGRASKHAPKRKKKRKKTRKPRVENEERFDSFDSSDDLGTAPDTEDPSFDPTSVSQSDLSPSLSLSEVQAIPLRESRVARVATYISAVAALIMLSVALWLFAHRNDAPDPGDLRAQVEAAEDVVTWEFVTKADPAVGEGATGSVVWSSALQAGVMVLDGLVSNQPKKDVQYQLWIVDKRREGPAIDGGVFNIDSEGEVEIPIDAKLTVGEPGAFVITVERPGGVVVSAQERVVMVAAAAE